MFNRNRLAIIIAGMITLSWLFVSYQDTKKSLNLMDTIEIIYETKNTWNSKGFSVYPIPQKEAIKENALKDADRDYAIAVSVVLGIVIISLVGLRGRDEKK